MVDNVIYAKELRKQSNDSFQRRPVITSGSNDIWSADLMDVSNMATKNKRKKFIFTVIDIYSRYAWAFPLANKSSESVLNAFKTIRPTPKNLWVDEGKEFYNREFKAYCKENNINLYHTYSGLKAVYVERFNRTLRNMISLFLLEHNTENYIDHFDEILNDYNHSKSSATDKTPFDIYKNGAYSKTKTYAVDDSKPKFAVGDLVRIKKSKKLFEKGSTPIWSKEVFKIRSIDNNQSPVMYLIEDMLGESITGKFYTQELQKTKVPNLKQLEKVISTKTENGRKKYLVKYKGLPEKFNEWLSPTELKSLK